MNNFVNKLSPNGGLARTIWGTPDTSKHEVSTMQGSGGTVGAPGNLIEFLKGIWSSSKISFLFLSLSFPLFSFPLNS